MNLPNKLTLLRVVLVIPFVAFLLLPQIPHHYLWATLVFAAASLTDMADGKIARKYHLITDFGKFLDPLADKVLVVAAMVCFLDMGLCSALPIVLILAREFLVSALRLVAVENGTVIAASIWGKVKTAFTMVAFTLILLLGTLSEFSWLPDLPLPTIAGVLMWITALLTVISGWDYLWQNRGCIKNAR